MAISLLAPISPWKATLGNFPWSPAGRGDAVLAAPSGSRATSMPSTAASPSMSRISFSNCAGYSD